MPRARTSVVWRFFDLAPDRMTATCKICKIKMKYFTGTSNLAHHARRRHVIEYNSAQSEHVYEESDNVISREQVPLIAAENVVQRETSLESSCLEANPSSRKRRLVKLIDCNGVSSSCSNSSELNPKTEDIFIEIEENNVNDTELDQSQLIRNSWDTDPLINNNTSTSLDKFNKTDNLTKTFESMGNSMKEAVFCLKTKSNAGELPPAKDGDTLFGEIIIDFLKKKTDSKKKNSFKKQIFVAMMDYSDSE